MQGVAVVTGASSGIGEAVAKRLLDAGHTIVAVQRRPARFAHAVTFLLDPASGYITGQTLFVCGGTSVSGTGGN